MGIYYQSYHTDEDTCACMLHSVQHDLGQRVYSFKLPITMIVFMCVCGSYSPNSSESPYSSNSPHFTLPDRHPLPLTSSTMAEGLRNNNAASLSQLLSSFHCV